MVRITSKRAYADGTVAVEIASLSLPCQLTANVRPPRLRTIRHAGVLAPALFATIDAVRAQPDLARFRFRVSNRWIKGTKSRSRIEAFSGAGAEHTHKADYSYDADHPAVLVGGDEGRLRSSSCSTAWPEQWG